MITDTKEEDGIDENEIFNFDPEALQIDEEDSDLGNFPAEKPEGDEAAAEEDPEKPETDEEEEEEEDEDLFGEDKKDEEEEADEEFTDEEFASLQKKLKTDFKTKEDLKNFLKKDDAQEEASQEDNEYDAAQADIDFYDPLLKLNDEDLMREQFKAVAINQKKDINDEDVLADIEDQVQDLVDSRTISLHAKDLRREIVANKIQPALAKKTSIEQKREAAKVETERKQTEELQAAFADIHQTATKENFFGIKTEPKRIQNAYKNAKSGSLIEQLKSDRKLAAEVAVLLEYKQEVYKKASGKTYSDGVGAVLGNYKANQESSTSKIANAQRKGSSGGSDAAKDLRRGLLS